MNSGVVAGLFLAHGLITAAIGSAAVTKPDAPGLPNTTLPWWPTPLGRSWLIDGLHLGAGASLGLGLLWTAAGATLAGAGLGLFGVPGLHRIWQPLAIAGGWISVAAVGAAFHPWYALALGINIAIILSDAGTRGPVAVG